MFSNTVMYGLFSILGAIIATTVWLVILQRKSDDHKAKFRQIRDDYVSSIGFIAGVLQKRSDLHTSWEFLMDNFLTCPVELNLLQHRFGNTPDFLLGQMLEESASNLNLARLEVWKVICHQIHMSQTNRPMILFQLGTMNIVRAYEKIVELSHEPKDIETIRVAVTRLGQMLTQSPLHDRFLQKALARIEEIRSSSPSHEVVSA